MTLTPWDEIFNIKLFYYTHSQASLIREIVKRTPEKGKLLEVGYGTGWTSVLLADLGFNVWGLDNDEENYKRACKNAERLDIAVNFCLGDLFDFGESTKDFDVGFSDGLFEHFTDEQIIQGLQTMKQHCRTVIMDVPAWKYRNAEIQRGDEIYRRNREWKQLIKQAGFKVKKMFGSVSHCPTWYQFLLPYIIGRSLAPHFTTKVGFVI
jgi:SAM-dependent methyltransferase